MVIDGTQSELSGNDARKRTLELLHGILPSQSSVAAASVGSVDGEAGGNVEMVSESRSFCVLYFDM